MLKIPRFNKPIWGWALYDFANSAFSTTIMAVIFPIYLATQIIPQSGLLVGSTRIPGESVWGYLVSLTMMLVAVSSPFLGAWADARGSKVKFLIFWTVAGCVSTLLLFQAQTEYVRFTLVSIFLAILCFEMSQVFYNALINDLGGTSERGSISGWGFAMGYIGGGLCLALNMALIYLIRRNATDSSDPSLPYRLCFASVGLWWLVFSIPLFLWVKDKPVLLRTGTEVGLMQSVRQLRQTLRMVLRMKDLSIFLVAYVIYNDAIQTVLLMASIFGARILNMSTVQLGLCYLLIQFTAFFGAALLGPVADKWSHKKVILLTLVIYIGITSWAMLMRRPFEFWILGVIEALVMGGSQAATRSLFANLIPDSKSGELFAFYAVVGKVGAVMGPFIFALVSQHFGLRPAVGSILLFFVVGTILLWFVDEARGRQLAQAPLPKIPS